MISRNTMAGTNKYFSRIERFVLPARLVDETIRRLREEGQFRVESIVFWLGGLDGSTSTVTHVVVPQGPGVFKHPLQVRVSEGIIAAIADLLDPPRLVLLGQVHTHMRGAFHSPTDDRYSIDTSGYLSLVVPNFAREEPPRWKQWAVYECAGRGSFRRQEAEEVEARFAMNPQLEVTVDVVSE